MPAKNPLLDLHRRAQAVLIPYGPGEDPVPIVGSFAELELEYAAIRRSCVLIDQPERGLIEVRGGDRLDFLNRMLTQDLRGLEPLNWRPSFWLNRKGRIDADVRVTALEDCLRLDVDVHAVERTLSGLGAFVIAEDVELRDATGSMHRLALHGPAAPALLCAIAEHRAGTPVAELSRAGACQMEIAGRPLLVERDDLTGETGLLLWMAAEHAADVYGRLLEAGSADGGPAQRPRVRPAGWHAFNIARIEAGRALYNVDFGPDSLPHETGLLRERVSFTKGCYLGQEIVARMESRGHSKQVLVALRCGQSGGAQEVPQPATGARIFAPDAPAESIGIVTSSAISPMLGGVPVCFAMVKHALAQPGAVLAVEAEGSLVAADVQESLVFWKRPGS